MATLSGVECDICGARSKQDHPINWAVIRLEDKRNLVANPSWPESQNIGIGTGARTVHVCPDHIESALESLKLPD